MKRLFGFTFLGLALALTVLAQAQAQARNVADGTWRLTTLAPLGTEENISALIKVETADGKTKATVVATAKGKAEVASFSSDGDKVRLVLKANNEQVFEGRLSPDGKRVYGLFTAGKAVSAAYLAPTTATTIEGKAGKQKLSATADELNAWAENASAMTKGLPASATIDVNLQLSMAFLAKKNATLASKYAVAADKALSNASVDLQIKVLQTEVRALTAAGNKLELMPLAARLEKLERPIDTTYNAEVPPFKAQPFTGRKNQSRRVVVMELFTGAQCPPCVAADVAFDVLNKTYKTGELALLQYHLHIPGADPMTNADTEARAKYYKVSSTPSTLFDGVSKGGGGGAMAAAQKKYDAYRKIIDPLLEEEAGCQIIATAKQVGERVEIQTRVMGVNKPGQQIKLRLVLVEENIRFVGSNKLRFHHHVVRAMPGGVAGVPVTNPTMTFNNEVNLPELRKQLNAYLDNYNLTGNRAPFPQVSRPLDLTGLHVIALIQDDATKEILQAVQVEVAH